MTRQKKRTTAAEDAKEHTARFYAQAKKLTKEELLTILAEGQSRIGRMVAAQLTPEAPERQAAFRDAFLSVVRWSMGEDETDPMRIVGYFEWRMRDEARKPVIEALRGLIEKLER